MTRGAALFLTLALGTMGGIVLHGAGAAKVADARLTAITARDHGSGTRLVVKATQPVPYVATRPDALTVLLDFRNVAADSVATLPKPDSKSPIAGVVVEAAESTAGPVSRVRISLARPLAHHVHSERNTVVVEFDRMSDKAPFVTPPVSRQSAQAAPAIDVPAIDPIAALGLQPAAAPAEATPAANVAPPGAMRPAAPTGPAAMLLQSGSITQPSASARTYAGNPVSLDFQQADLRAVLRVFSEISGLNIVIDPAVQGTVDVALKDVPWDQALDIILRANKLGYLVDGTVVRIAPLTVLTEEESQRRKLADEQALAGELRVLTKTLSYAKGEDLKDLITKSALSQRGTVQVDVRTNTMIITDLAERITTATDLIASLDRPQPQVEIEARIVETRKNYARALGIQWGFTGRVDPALGNSTNLAFPNRGVLAGGAGAPGSGTAVDLGVRERTSALGLALGSINGAFNLDAALSAAESSGNVRLLSTPRVSTQNNVEAEIAQGEQIPYQTVSNNTTTVNFKDAALTLKVTPQITAVGTVIMKIAVDNGSRGTDVGSPPIPSINTQRASTTVQVTDGQTTVIGGIFASRASTTTDRTPGLAQVPLLKWLFRRDALGDDSRELLIFITPRIIQN